MNSESGCVVAVALSKRFQIRLQSSSSSSSSIRHSFTSEDLVSAPNLELGCAMSLHNCASDYIPFNQKKW